MRHKTIPATILLCLTFLPQARADEAARALLQQCLPAPAQTSQQARVEIEVTHKHKPAESYHYLRLESPAWIFITPDNRQGPALLLDKQRQRAWHYGTETAQFSAATETNTPLWLLSETLLQARQLAGFDLSLSSHNSFGGLDYYTVKASRAEERYAKRSLSFKRSATGECSLIRAAYFVDGDKLSKKLFFQWRMVDNTKMLKALHVEDVKTLEAVRYHIEAVEVVDHIDAQRFPAPPEDEF